MCNLLAFASHPAPPCFGSSRQISRRAPSKYRAPLHPAGNLELVIEAMQDRTGAPATVAAGSGHVVRMALPPGCEGAFVARFLQAEAPP